MARHMSTIHLLTAFDRARISALIRFVNVKLESVGPLRKIFGDDDSPDNYRRAGGKARVPIGRWATTLGEMKSLQALMRDWLAQIRSEHQVGPEIAAKIEEWLQQARKTDAHAAGSGRITVRLELDGPRAQCMYALLLLRDTEGLVKHVGGRCPWCGLYFFDPDVRTGRQNKFCPRTQTGTEPGRRKRSLHANCYSQYYETHDHTYRPTPDLP